MTLVVLCEYECIDTWHERIVRVQKPSESGGGDAAVGADHRAQHLLRKAKREAHRLRKAQHPDEQFHFR